jgi:hypothetical protein
VKSYPIALLSSMKATPQIWTSWLTFGLSANQRTLRKDPTNLEIKRIYYSEEHLHIEQDKPELSASFYTEWNPADQAQPHPYQSSVFRDYQFPVNFNIVPDPVGPIMTSIPMAQTQVVADKAKGYGMNKPTPFAGN